MKKVVLSALLGLAIIVVAFVVFLGKGDLSENDQRVLQKTLDISRGYTVLRLQTDDVLLEAKNYPSYEEWQKEMDIIISKWSDMEKEALALEGLANEMFDEQVSFQIINSALAYDKQEISNVFDRAPAGKKIATLAKHLGVDAKRAYAILTQDQAQVQADAWNEAGDTFKKLEVTAVAIKDTSKVVTFVGTIAISGGTAAIAAGSTLSKAAVIVAGADLTLEITDDAAKIALGDRNKVSTVVGSARAVTEPASAILMISALPSNVTKAVDKLSVVTFGADQLNSSIQEGKVIGIKLPAAEKSSTAKTSTVSVLENEEISEWLNNEGLMETEETIDEIEEDLKNSLAKAGESKLEKENTETKPGDDRQTESKAVNKSGDGKLIQIDFKNATGETWVIEGTSFGSEEYRGEMDAIHAKDFAVGGGASFAKVNQSADQMKNSTSFSETSKNTYEYKIQLVAGGPMPEDEDEQYVYDPFVAVVDFVVQGTYGKPVTVVWDGSTFKQLD